MPIFATPKPISVTLDIAIGDTRIIASDHTDTTWPALPRTDLGRVRTSPAGADAPDGSEDSVAVRARTANGGVVVHRA